MTPEEIDLLMDSLVGNYYGNSAVVESIYEKNDLIQFTFHELLLSEMCLIFSRANGTSPFKETSELIKKIKKQAQDNERILVELAGSGIEFYRIFDESGVTLLEQLNFSKV